MKLSYIFKASIGSLVFFLALNLKAQTTPAVGNIKSKLISLINTTDVQNEFKKLGSRSCIIDENSYTELDVEDRSRLIADRDYLSSLNDPNTEQELSILIETLNKWPRNAQQKYYFTVQCPDKKIYDLVVWNIKEKNKLEFLKLDPIIQLYQAL